MRLAFALALAACHHGSTTDQSAAKPSSCIIEHDGGVTQCFEDIGATAKREGEKYCGEMHGAHTFRAGEACPREGVVGSCTKRAGTEFERIERCYRDEAACEARCVKSSGEFKK